MELLEICQIYRNIISKSNWEEKMLVIATDLDNTLIYSQKKMAKQSCCVEWKEGRELSYMTEESYKRLQKINEKEEIHIIPVTTRSLEQYQRIEFLEKTPKLALVANGGILLVNGKIDETWRQETLDIIAESKKELEKAWNYLEKDKNRSFELRNIDDMFLFTKSERPADTIAGLEKIMNPSLVSVIENYNKIYVMPYVLDKGLAVKRLKNYLKTGFFHKNEPFTIIAAGDSSFDIPMLKEADYAIALQEPCFIETLKEKEHTCFWDGEKNLFAGYVLDIVEKML